MKIPKEGVPGVYHITYGGGFKARLGEYFMKDGHLACFDSKTEAIKAVRIRQTHNFDSEDYAVVREGDRYAVRKINTVNDPIADDIDNLKELDSVVLTDHGRTVIASVIADTGEVKNFLPLPKWRRANEMHSVEEIRQRLEDMHEELSRRGDHRAVFPCSYIATTEKASIVIESIRNENHPDHDEFRELDDRLIENIVIEFAKFYFEAFDNYEWGEHSMVPPVWKFNFDEAKAQTTSVVEDMLLGYNAHISYDLSIILTKKLPDGKPLYDPGDSKHVNTFNAFNRILIEETDTIIQYVTEMEDRLGGSSTAFITSGKTLGTKLLGAGGLEDMLLKFFSKAREEAEENSRALIEGRITQEEFAEKITKRARAIGRMLPNSGRLFKEES
jgi:uncharacterized protein DUF5995